MVRAHYFLKHGLDPSKLRNMPIFDIMSQTVQFRQPIDKGWVSAEIGINSLFSTIPTDCIALTIMFRNLLG